MPFSHPAQDGTSKVSMAVKTTAFITVGLMIPVAMSAYALYVLYISDSKVWCFEAYCLL